MEYTFWKKNKKLILAYLGYILFWIFTIYNVQNIEKEDLEGLTPDNTFPVFVAVMMIFVLSVYFIGTIILLSRRKQKRYFVFLLFLFIPFVVLSLF